MARIKKETPQVEKTEITQSEVDSYTAFCKENPQYRVGGVYVSPRERYCIMMGYMTLKDGEFAIQEPAMMKYVDELEKRRPRERYKPSKEWWDEIKDKTKMIAARVVHSEAEEIPF